MCEDTKDIKDNDVRNNEKQITNPVKAIRAKCLDCCCGNRAEIENCTITKCALYPFRFGKNPYRTKKEYTEEELEKMRERTRNMRNMKNKQ